MSNLYAMRRANGDWFALEDHKRLRVPLFHSSHDAMMARLRNVGMLLFDPVVLNARLFKEIAPAGGSDVDFCLVKDPFARLSRGRLVEPGQLALLMGNREEEVSTTRGPGSPSGQPAWGGGCGWVEVQSVPRNGNGHAGSATSPQAQSEWWN
jgi:hypothetical protein